MNREPTMPDEDLLSAYLDGECNAAERTWVEEQLGASAEMRRVLDDVRAARDAVRALPLRDAPPEFWARILEPDAEPGIDAGTGATPELEVASGGGAVDLAARRARRRPSRWVAAVAGVAAAFVVGAVILVPHEKSVTPPVATFADAHAVRSSLQNDAVSALVPLGVQGGFRR